MSCVNRFNHLGTYYAENDPKQKANLKMHQMFVNFIFEICSFGLFHIKGKYFLFLLKETFKNS